MIGAPQITSCYLIQKFTVSFRRQWMIAPSFVQLLGSQGSGLREGQEGLAAPVRRSQRASRLEAFCGLLG